MTYTKSSIYFKPNKMSRNSVKRHHATLAIDVTYFSQYISSSSSAISWRTERSQTSPSHDLVIKFFRKRWLGLATPFCRCGFLKNLHREGNVLVSSGNCKKKKISSVSCSTENQAQALKEPNVGGTTGEKFDQ